MEIVIKVLQFFMSLSLLVAIHEFGHFIVARLFKVKVSAFSIGFGKTLLSKTDKQGTEWKLSAVPLGGYCQFLGDADASSSTSEVDLSKYSEEEQKQLFVTQSPLKKLAICVAGPLFNYLFAFFVFFGLFFFVGSYDIPPIVSGVLKDSPAEKAGILPQDTVIEINGKKVEVWDDIHQEVSLSIDNVYLKVSREGKVMEFTLPLAEIDYAFDETEKPIKRKMIGIINVVITDIRNKGIVIDIFFHIVDILET